MSKVQLHRPATTSVAQALYLAGADGRERPVDDKALALELV